MSMFSRQLISAVCPYSRSVTSLGHTRSRPWLRKISRQLWLMSAQPCSTGQPG
jgi:hypothetical protein